MCSSDLDSNTFLQLRQANQRHVPEVPQPHKMTVGELGNIALIGTNLLGKTADMASRGIGELQRRVQEQEAIDQRGAEIAQFRMNQNRLRQGEGFGLQQARERMIAEGGRTPMAFDAQGNPVAEQDEQGQPLPKYAQDISYPSNLMLPRAQRETPAYDPSIDTTRPPGPKEKWTREGVNTGIPQLAPEQIAMGAQQSGDIGRQIDGGDTLNMAEPRPLRTLAQLRMDALKAGLTNNAGEKARVLEDLAALGGGAYAPQSFEDVLSGGGQENTLKEFSHTLNPAHALSPEQLALMLARTENARARTVGQNQKNEVFADTGAATAQANRDKARAAADVAAGTVQSQIGNAGSEAALKAEQAKNAPAEFESKQGLRKSQTEENRARAIADIEGSVGGLGKAKKQQAFSQAVANYANAHLNNARAKTELSGDTAAGRIRERMTATTEGRLLLGKQALEQKVKAKEITPADAKILGHLQALMEGASSDEMLPETSSEISKLYPDLDLAAVDKLVVENVQANQKTRLRSNKKQQDIKRAKEQGLNILLNKSPELLELYAPYFEVDPLNPEL